VHVGFTQRAATWAGALNLAGREAFLRYVLQPPIAQQSLERGAGDLVHCSARAAIRVIAREVDAPQA
jgi:hypothetical protein